MQIRFEIITDDNLGNDSQKDNNLERRFTERI